MLPLRQNQQTSGQGVPPALPVCCLASGADQFARLFEQMPAGTVQMDEQAAQPLLALCAEELADLVARVFDTWTPEPERFTLPDVFGNTQGQLGEVLQSCSPG